ncbi:lia operon protein LiaG [Oikeobacillus pervagus]|uniref:Lia operon protein LiaG n=1 Tax=Oikeobacillus pervagus TaxID=1325931 RepID=A0AAJ1WHY2_9BACI|nr:DUF4097 family beta strand repeat-containing protein [Oikeobacillus pervagus]MDQ0216707.1 lia operon protein LiaG [Oikeobacillus pervagus]
MRKFITMILVLAGLAIVFFIWNFDSLWPFGDSTKSVSVNDNVDVIKLDISSIQTTVIPENRKDVHAELEGRGKVTVKKRGNMITVEQKNKWNFSFLWFNRPKLTIFIPKDFDRNMEIDLGSGSLNFTGPSKSQPMKLNHLTVDLGSGFIKMKNIETKEFTNDVSSGNVEIQSLTTDHGIFDLSSGRINLKDYEGKLEGDVSSGLFNVQMKQLVDSVDIEVSSGRVSLDLPEDADFKLKGKTGSGIVNYDFPLNDTKKSRKHIEGVHGSGKHTINIEVGSGSINIR